MISDVSVTITNVRRFPVVHSNEILTLKYFPVSKFDTWLLFQAYDLKKKCSMCEVLILNEVQLQSHLRGKNHCEKVSLANGGRKMSGDEIQEANLVYIVDAAPTDADPKRLKSIERTKAAKKRVKKIKTRMAQVWSL